MRDGTGRPAQLPRRRRSTRLAVAALVVALPSAAVLAGCGGGDDLSTGDPTSSSTAELDPDEVSTGDDAGEDGAGGQPERPQPGHIARITSVEGAALRDSDRRAVIIDVRSLEEYLGGHVVGAQHIELRDDERWERRTSALDPTRPVVVYCDTGVLAAEAAERLVDQGFAEVYDLGGMSDWTEGDLPLDR